MYGDEAGPQWRRLCQYVAEVAAAVGVGPEACCCSPDRRANAYIAVEHRVPQYPERDAALLWDEENGWAVGVETGCGEDVFVLRYLGGDLLPAPKVVARFLSCAAAGESPGRADPPGLGGQGSGHQLSTALERYAFSTLGYADRVRL